MGTAAMQAAAVQTAAVPVPAKLLRVDEAAKILSVSETTVRAYLAEGLLKAVPAGVGQVRRHLRISPSSVQRLLAE